jgi:ABC-type branched-subunit amino acid transport system substrate-binding protein
VRRTLLLVAAAVAAAAIPGAQAGPAKEPGITPTRLLVGGTAPLSGPEVAYAAVARGAEAYFKYVNSRGGVHGRKVTYRYLDDAYDPAQTVQKTRELVQQHRVFAIFNSVGTEQTLAVRPFLNQLKVPQLFVGSGASAIGDAYRRYPYTMGYLTSFRGEAAIYGRHALKAFPGARIAVLHENSDYGKDMLAGLRKGLGAQAGRIVEVQTYEVTDADLNAQLARLKASGANVFMLFALPKQTIQAFLAADRLGWRPRVFVNAVSVDPFVMDIARLNTNNRTTQGAITTAFLKDPTDPAMAKDRGVLLYKRLMRKYLPGKEKEVAHIYGMAAAHTFVGALRKAGKQLTRAKLVAAATSLDERDNPFLVNGVVVKTSRRDYYPISRTRLLRYDRGRWKQFGGFLTVR